MRQQKGNLIIGTILLIVALMLLPFTLKLIFPQLEWVYKVILIFGIYAFVTQMMQSNGTLTLLITSVLVYFMAFKYSDVFTSLWFITLILTTLGGTILVTSARDFLGFGKGAPGMLQPQHPPR